MSNAIDISRRLNQAGLDKKIADAIAEAIVGKTDDTAEKVEPKITHADDTVAKSGFAAIKSSWTKRDSAMKGLIILTPILYALMITAALKL